jgi:hypothetical protein
MASATDNALFIIDDPTLDTDEGVAFSATMRSAVFDWGPASGFTKLRRIAQAVALAGPVTMVITPIVDGQIVDDQAETFTLATIDGIEQVIESNVAVNGTRFQVQIEITAHEGPTALGEADQWISSRRTTRDS